MEATMSETRTEYVEGLRAGAAALPRRCDRLSFDEPWQGRAFGLVLALAEGNAYRFEDFRQSLISTIGNWESSHAVDDPSWEYYEQWLAAFERLVVDRGIVTPEELDRRTEEFRTRTREEVI